MSANGNDSNDAYSKILSLLSKMQKLNYTGSHIITKILTELFGKGYERLVYWNEYEIKSENKNTTNEFRYFLE